MATNFLQLRAVRPRRETVAAAPPTVVTEPPRKRRWLRGILLGLLGLILLGALAVGALAVLASRDTLLVDSNALARVSTPLIGGTVESVSVFGPHGGRIPVAIRGQRIWPLHRVPTNQLLSIELTVRRPSWIGWLVGKRDRLLLRTRTPSATLLSQYLTLPSGAPVSLRFSPAVAELATGQPGHLHPHVLSAPTATVDIRRAATAGSFLVAAVPRTWEVMPAPVLLSYFPQGAAPSAVVSPAAGSHITPTSTLEVTFSGPIAQVLKKAKPTISPHVKGYWYGLNSHTLAFRPAAFGFPLGSTVTLALHGHARLVHGGSGNSTSWSVPAGSSLRADQILAQLGYLPLKWTPKSGSAHLGPTAQLTAAVQPPAGKFSWRYGNTPDSLKALWQPGQSTQLTRGALMSFENDHGLATDGVLGAAVWRALLSAAAANHPTSFGFTFVMVSEATEHLKLWHSGKFVFSTPVNTGIAAAPTATGIFPVYEHLRVTTMQGLNPDGSKYNDPGIQFVSYFNGGDALHAFTRAQYGFPQSLGCVEMPLGAAGTVWPYTPIGTIVDVS